MAKYSKQLAALLGLLAVVGGAWAAGADLGQA